MSNAKIFKSLWSGWKDKEYSVRDKKSKRHRSIVRAI